MKKIFIIIISGILMIPTILSAQKTDQTTLYNEVYAGYGAASVFYFKGINHNYDNSNVYFYNSGDPTSAGTFFAGYNRTVSNVFNMGIVFSYMNVQTQVTDNQYQGILPVTGTSYDNLYSMVARVKFAYVNKSVVQVYSGACLGVIVDVNKVNIGGTEYNDRKLLPAGQLILMGIRGGRKLGGFLEFGFGTNGIVSGGISYKFGKE